MVSSFTLQLICGILWPSVAGWIHWPFQTFAKWHPPAPTIWQWLLRLGTAVARGTRGRRCTRSTSTRRPEDETAENSRETAMRWGMVGWLLSFWANEPLNLNGVTVLCYVMLVYNFMLESNPIADPCIYERRIVDRGFPCFSLGLKASKFKIAARVQCLGRPETQAKCGASWRCFLRLEGALGFQLPKACTSTVWAFGYKSWKEKKMSRCLLSKLLLSILLPSIPTPVYTSTASRQHQSHHLPVRAHHSYGFKMEVQSQSSDSHLVRVCGKNDEARSSTQIHRWQPNDWVQPFIVKCEMHPTFLICLDITSWSGFP